MAEPPERSFDHHSVQPMSDGVRRTLIDALDRYGDPLRHHERGRASARALEDGREEIAEAIGAQPDEIVFTSGAEEASSLAVQGVISDADGPARRVVMSAVEHPAVEVASAQPRVERSLVGVDEHGRVDVDRFASEVREPGTVLASLQHANHETGTIQPVAEVASFARHAGVPVHTDAAQTMGRLPIDVGDLGVDLLSFGAPALGGPPGVGVLYVHRGIRIQAIVPGDDRERRRRAGLQHVAAIAATAVAVRESLATLADRAARGWSLTTRLRGALEAIPGARVHGHPTHRAPHLVCCSFDDVELEVLLMALDQRGFRVDGGSVVSGSLHEPSRVLEAMGFFGIFPIRASVGPETTEEDVDALASAIAELVGSLSRI